MTTKNKQIEILEDRYKTALRALEKLKEHLEFINSEGMLKYSTTFLIVDKALEELKDDSAEE